MAKSLRQNQQKKNGYKLSRILAEFSQQQAGEAYVFSERDV